MKNFIFQLRTTCLLFLIAVKLLFFFSVASDQAFGQTTKIQGTCFGPIAWHVVVPEIGDQTSIEALEKAIHGRLSEINDRMSTYKADSEVSRFNRSKTTDWFEVSLETATIVQKSIEFGERTDGRFDITVGPLVSAWKFGAGKDDDQFQPPSLDKISSILQNVGYQKLESRFDPPAIKKSVSGVQIDLSAIAKGYAVDEVARQLEKAGYEDYFVQVGEEVFAKGKHPAGRYWICGIEKPEIGKQVVDIKVALVNQAIATSGDYRQFYEFEGKKFSHAIDPKTGFPTESSINLASISAPDCLTADALATAVMVGGPAVADSYEVGIRYIKHYDSSEQSKKFLLDQNELYPKPIGRPPVSSSNPLFTIGITVLVFGLFLLLMSVGVIFAGKPIKGSCGGLGNIPGHEGKSACELCRNPSEECKKRLEEESKEAAEQA